MSVVSAKIGLEVCNHFQPVFRRLTTAASSPGRRPVKG